MDDHHGGCNCGHCKIDPDAPLPREADVSPYYGNLGMIQEDTVVEDMSSEEATCTCLCIHRKCGRGCLGERVIYCDAPGNEHLLYVDLKRNKAD